MTVENTNGAAQPADAATQQIGVDAADEGISALEQMMVDGESQPTEQETTQDETPESDTEQDTEADDEAESEDGEEEDAEESEETDEDEQESEQPHKGPRAEKRIHKLTAQRNAAREKLATIEKDLESARAAAESNVALPADRLTPDQFRAIKQANALEAREEFLLAHVGVGYEDEQDPSRSLTAKQVAEELVHVRRAQSQVGDARKLYDEAKRQFLEDAKAGKLLRLSKQALNKTKKPVPTVKATATPSATAARSAASSHVQRRGMNADRFHKSGGSEDAAVRELEELVGV